MKDGYVKLKDVIEIINGFGDDNQLVLAKELKEKIDAMPEEKFPYAWEEGVPPHCRGVLVIASGYPRKNVIYNHALCIGYYDKYDGWFIDDYPEWKNPEVEYWTELPDMPEGIFDDERPEIKEGIIKFTAAWQKR